MAVIRVSESRHREAGRCALRRRQTGATQYHGNERGQIGTQHAWIACKSGKSKVFSAPGQAMAGSAAIDVNAACRWIKMEPRAAPLARNPLPVNLAYLSSVDVPFVFDANKLLGEPSLLLIIEACEKRLGGIGQLFLIGGPLAHRIGSLSHLIDEVDGPLLLGAIGSQRDLAIRPPFGVVAHGALEASPVVFLLRGEAQLGPHTRGARVGPIRKLVCGRFRVA
jgi:hypothetical protein